MMKREQLRELLLSLATDGVLRPEDVVEFARPESSPLHECFTWDDSQAADLYRLWQARHLIARVHVVVEEVPADEVRAFVSLREDRHPGGVGYRILVDVMADQELRVKALAEAKQDMMTFKQKYKHLVELADVLAAMSDALSRMED